MKVLVTGGNGLVGSYVVAELFAKGHEVRLLLRENCDTALLKDIERCEVIKGDILDPLMLDQAVAGCDAVIHCAGIVSFNPRRNKEIYNVNVNGTANVVNACLRGNVRKLIHTSSIAALGRSEQSSMINEKAKWEEGGNNSFYAKSKYLAELEVFRAGEEGLDFAMVNPSVVLGVGDETKSSTRLLAFIKKLPWFYPNGGLNVVDVRDVSRVMVALLHIDHRNRLVLNSGHVRYKYLYELVTRESGMESFQTVIPDGFIKMIAFFDQFRTFFNRKEPFVTRENAKFLSKMFDYNSLYYDKLFSQPLIKPEETILFALGK